MNLHLDLLGYFPKRSLEVIKQGEERVFFASSNSFLASCPRFSRRVCEKIVVFGENVFLFPMKEKPVSSAMKRQSERQVNPDDGGNQQTIAKTLCTPVDFAGKTFGDLAKNFYEYDLRGVHLSTCLMMARNKFAGYFSGNLRDTFCYDLVVGTKQRAEKIG